LPWAAGDRDDPVEDDIVGQEVDEVVALSKPVEAFFNNTKEWIEGSEVFQLELDDLLVSQCTAALLRQLATEPPGH
jgi:hypothetical protein